MYLPHLATLNKTLNYDTDFPTFPQLFRPSYSSISTFSTHHSPISLAPLFPVVTILCPPDVSVLADPGSTEAAMSWFPPELQGWDGPSNFTSNSNPGDNLLVGTHRVDYVQWFAEQDLVLRCSFDVAVTGG